MELHFSEIGEEISGEISEKKTQPISYDDILAKLNVKIVDGKMQYIAPVLNAKVPKTNGKGNGKGNSAIIEPSYIYNKYFKKEMAHRTARSPPKSREEYNQRLADEMRKHAISQRLMSQAKSKKLAFYTQAYGNNAYGIKKDPDTLFRIKLNR